MPLVMNVSCSQLLGQGRAGWGKLLGDVDGAGLCAGPGSGSMGSDFGLSWLGVYVSGLGAGLGFRVQGLGGAGWLCAAAGAEVIMGG